MSSPADAFGGSVANGQIEGIENVEKFPNQFGRSGLDVLAAFTIDPFPVVFKFCLPAQQPILERIPLLDQLLNLGFGVRWRSLRQELFPFLVLFHYVLIL